MINFDNEEALKEKLNYKYELINFEVDSNIHEEMELKFLDDLFKNVVETENSVVMSTFNSIESIGFIHRKEMLKDYAYYISEYIDEYISDNNVESLDEALYGGLHRYLEAQYLKNRYVIYKNILYYMMNQEIDSLKKSNEEDLLNDKSKVFLKFDIDTVEDYVEDFVEEKLYFLEGLDRLKIYELFCNFLNDKINN